MKQQLIILVGLPHSGQDEWTNNWWAKSPLDHIKVNRQAIKVMLSINQGIYMEDLEKLISTIESTAIRNALKKGYNVVVNSHNLNPVIIQKWELLVELLDIDITLEIINFPNDVNKSLALDKKLPQSLKYGKRYIKELNKKYLTITEDDMTW